MSVIKLLCSIALETMPDFQENGESGRLVVELGPLEYVPYSTFMFLNIIDNWKGGAQFESKLIVANITNTSLITITVVTIVFIK